jgi:hypothetical protein
MLAGGLFEYNFGDSEFLMLFLIVISLPFAAGSDRPGEGSRSDSDAPPLNDPSVRAPAR